MSSYNKAIYGEEKDLGCFTQMARGLLVLVNIIFAIAAIAGLAVASLAIIKEDQNIAQYCTMCKHFNYYTLALFGALFFFSILGACALIKRQSCLLMVYGFFLFIFFLAIAVVLVVVLLIKTNHFDDEMREAWNDAARDDPAKSCKFMTKLNCTGWTADCYAIEGQNYTVAPRSGAANETLCPVCTHPVQKEVNKATELCHDVLMHDFNKYYLPIVIVTGSLLGVTLLSLFVTCKVKREYDDYEEVNQRY